METHLIPLAFEALAGARPPLTIHGDDYPTRDGTCLRDYVHVEDLAQAHLLALESLAARDGARAYNLGSGAGATVREVVDAVGRVAGREVPVRIGAASRRRCAGRCWPMRRWPGANWAGRPRHSDLATIISSAWAWHGRQMQSRDGTMSERPLVTFALLCFNQEQFVAEAVRSALAQDYAPLEILISDDASTDRTWEIVQREVQGYVGPHRIRLHRNAVNLSCTVHTLSALAMASADLVVFGAGDDISEPQRTAAIAAVAQAQPQAMSFWSDMRLDRRGRRRSGRRARLRRALDGIVGNGRSRRGPGRGQPGLSQKNWRVFWKRRPARGLGGSGAAFSQRAAGRRGEAPGVLLRWRRHIGSMETH